MTRVRQALCVVTGVGLVAAGGLLGATAGCASWSQAKESQLVGGQASSSDFDPSLPAEPAVSTQSATQSQPVGLFGEFPNREEIPFEAGPAQSLVQHTRATEGADFDPAMDPTGKLLAFASTRHTREPDLYIKTAGGSAVTQVTSGSAADIQPEFSPDGRHLAFASNRAGNFDIWMIGVDGQGATQLTDSPAEEVRPTWAPDGQRLAYSSLNPQSGQWELWLLDLRQPGTRKFIGYGLYPQWSPVDELIVYQRARQRGQQWFSVWTLRLVDGEPRFPTEVAASSTEAYILPAFSPDGQRIVFCAVGGSTAGKGENGMGGAADLWVIDVDGSQPIRLTEGQQANYGPRWAKDGRVYYSSVRSGSENIWSVRPPPAGIRDESAPSDQVWEHLALRRGLGGPVSDEGR